MIPTTLHCNDNTERKEKVNSIYEKKVFEKNFSNL